MRTLGTCFLMLVLVLSAAACWAAPEQPAGAQAVAASAPAPGGLAALSSLGEMNGSHLDLNLYLSIPELFEVLARVGAIPKDVADRALAASKAGSAEATAPASYVKVEVHIQMAEVATLLAAMAQAQPRRVPAPPRDKEPAAMEKKPAAAPAK
jgi:hypothetical protein